MPKTTLDKVKQGRSDNMFVSQVTLQDNKAHIRSQDISSTFSSVKYYMKVFSFIWHIKLFPTEVIVFISFYHITYSVYSLLREYAH